MGRGRDPQWESQFLGVAGGDQRPCQQAVKEAVLWPQEQEAQTVLLLQEVLEGVEVLMPMTASA